MRRNTNRRNTKRRRKMRKHKLLSKYIITNSNYLFCNIEVYIEEIKNFNVMDGNILNDNCTPFISDLTNNCIMPYNIRIDPNTFRYYLDGTGIPLTHDYLDNNYISIGPLLTTNYLVKNYISKGTYGAVYRIKLANPRTGNSRIFAIKIATSSTIESEEWTLRDKLSDIRKCTCFIPILPLSSHFTLMPIADGSLHDLVEKKIFFTTYDQVLRFYVTLIEIFNCVTDNGLVYIDIKPRNILFKVINANQIQLLIGDIGSVKPDNTTGCYPFNINFLPPTIQYDKNNWTCYKNINDPKVRIIQLYAITMTVIKLLYKQNTINPLLSASESLIDIYRNLVNFSNYINLYCMQIVNSVNRNVITDFNKNSLKNTNTSNKSFSEIFRESL